ncbi:uncharacterized protein [Syngnathus scovelli]|uniref:uncharacterized protein isoform X3 n=1 Tax=Syngnathus scovelli TaxID=161590 RepID=UPI00210FF48F|nr:uncharacterized protein LOC125987933 isoform X3 [Syngnathus scovelli]
MMETVDGDNRRASGSEQRRMATKASYSDCQIPVRDHVGAQPTPYDLYEEFFSSSSSSQTSIHLVSALVTFSGQHSDVVKQGYLGKLEREHRRYFVLRAGSHTGPSRLEWYKSLETFATMEKSSGKYALFGPSKQGVIYLRSCIGVGCLCSLSKGLTVALYAQDQTMVLVADSQQDQEAWYLSIKKLMEEHRDEDQACDDEDDGYCTLPPAGFFKEHIHEAVRDTVRALRALPDFGRSPVSNHNPLLVPKRCRPKYREKKNLDAQTGPTQCRQTNGPEPQSPVSLRSMALPEPDRYMDMRTQPPAGECGEGEGVDYMMMSPQVSRGSCMLPQDAYVTMSSPQKQESPVSPQRGVNRCTSLYTSHWPTNDWSQDTPTHNARLPTEFGPTRSPKGHADTSGLTTPFVRTKKRFAVRSGLASCLPSCLLAED